MTFGSLRRLAGMLLVLTALMWGSDALAQTDAERSTGLFSHYEITSSPWLFAGGPAEKTSSPLSTIASDDFSSGSLNPGIWTFINPGTPSTLTFTGTGTGNARLAIAVPAGTAHDVWTGGNNAPRIMQTAPNTDFEVETKFESPLTAKYQLEGIIIQQDANNYLRFDFFHDGASIRVFAASISGGVATSRFNAAIASGTPLFLRVRRIGTQWTQTYSFNGTTWLNAASFSHTLTVNSIGPFAGNAGSPAPAFTASIDYFFNTASPIIPEDPATNWWSSTRRFRLPVEIKANGYQRTNKATEVDVDFTQLLTALGQTAPLSVSSFRIIEVTSDGMAVDTMVPFQFDPEQGYNASSNARGSMAFLLKGVTQANASRYFHIYFETTAGGTFAPPVFASQLTVTDNVIHEGAPNIKVATPKGTYFYDKMGGGFSSIEDAQGNDWINYHPTGGTAGDFRGVPNLGTVFHPGYTNSISTLESQGPLRARMRTQSIDGFWECVWDIFPDYARMKMLKKGANYWFLYEGTPGGSLNPTTDFVYRSNGQRSPLSTAFTADLAAPEWAYFGDAGMRRAFYVVHHEDDFQPDYYKQSEGNMTIFGFGRQDPCCTRYLSGTPQNFTIGFADDSTYSAVTPIINAAFRDMQSIQNAPESHAATMLPPGIVSHPANKSVFVGETTTFQVLATGTSPVTYQWQGNGTDINGATSAIYTTPAAVLTDNGSSFRCRVSNALGTTTSLGATLTVAPAPGAPVSDDFNNFGLNANRWTFVNPLEDATLTMTGTGTTNARLAILLPGGISHDMWTGGLMAPRVLQNISNTDFEVEVKFEGGMTQAYQAEGIIVQQDNANLLRFDFTRDATKIRLFCASFVNGTPTVRKDTTIALAILLHLRVKRQGNQWTARYSFNGTTWYTGATFSHSLTARSVGPFVANAGTAPPPFYALIDYFFNTASPITPEDGGTPGDPAPPVITNVQLTPRQYGVQVSWETNEPATSVVQFGKTTLYELGQFDQSGLRTTHTVDITGLQQSTFYNLHILSADTLGNLNTSPNYTATTLPNTNPIINIWYGHEQTFGQIGNPVPDINILGNVSDPDGIFSLSYRLNGGSPRNLSIGSDKRRLYKKGDFNIDIPYASLLSGTNSIIITAVDSISSTTLDTIRVNYVSGNTWPRTYTANWSTSSRIDNAGQVLDGLWNLESGTVRPAQLGYDRIIAIGDQTWNNYEVVVPITIHSIDSAGFPAPSSGPSIGLMLRWPGHSDSPIDLAGLQPKTGFLPYGALGWYTWSPSGQQHLNILGNNLTTLAEDTTGTQLAFGTRYFFKMRVENTVGGNSLYRLKVWEDSSPEPAHWTLAGEQASGNPGTGGLLLLSHHVDASFGNVTVVPVGDTTNILNTSLVGSGSINKSPNLSSYPTGQVVRLTAVPASGWIFDHWSGDISGNNNPDSIIMTENKSVTATFVGETTPPQISNIRVSATSSHATIRWTTNETASSVVSYGPTSLYENGTQTSNGFVIEHAVVLSGLAPNSSYHYRITSADGNGNVSYSTDMTFGTTPLSTLASDDFNSFGLNGNLWSFINPLNDGQLFFANIATPNASVNISVPGGVTHEPWTNGISVPRIVQAINNADFELEVKYFTGMNQRFQTEGIVVQQDSNDFIRFEFHSDGAGTRMFAANIVNGVATVAGNAPVASNSTSPLYMRVKREGDAWTQSFSLDGQSWTATPAFSREIVSGSVALYAGNAGTPPPVYTSTVDYFFNLASPVVPEDGGTPNDTIPPLITNVQVSTTNVFSTITWTTDEPATSGVAFGPSSAYENGSITDSSFSTTHSVTLTGLSTSTLYHYVITSADSANNSRSTSDNTFTTSGFASTIVSDDFNRATLDTTIWQFINPFGDASRTMLGTGTNNAWLSITVPPGVPHDVWRTGNFAPRIMQQTNNTDFEIEVKYESGVAQKYQIQGILVEQNGGNFIRADFNSDSVSTRFFVATFADSIPTLRSNISISPNNISPLYLRVQRQGSLWSVKYSTNGNIWTTGVAFNHTMTVNAVGAFAGNAGTNVPGHSSNLDYFFNTAIPKLPEDGEPAISPAIAMQPADTIVGVGQQGRFVISATGTPTPTFQWLKNGIAIPGATGTFYETPSATIGDSGAIYRCRVTNIAGTILSNAALLHVHTAPSVTTPAYDIVVAQGAQGTLIVDALGTPPLSYQWLRAGTEITGATHPTYTTPPATIADSGVIFRCRVSNLVGSVLGNQIRLIVHTPATITSQPRDTTIGTGQTATFKVTAVGFGPISYQWLRNDTELPGATFATLIFSPTTNSDSGSILKCRVTNPGGTVLSNPALLRVLDAPIILAQPVNDSVLAGTTAIFSVTVSGATPLSYQWQRNGVNINGATGQSYTTPPVSPGDSGTGFRCLISNAVGSVTSGQAFIVVMLAPTITGHPQNKLVSPGQTASFIVSFTGSFPFRFQWQRNGVDIPGATLLGYTTGATTAADSGATFRCRVTNAVGEVWSNAALLEVAQPATIVQHPGNQSVAQGQTATFTVVATGTPILTYQWQRNNIDIFGANSVSYTTPPTVKADSGAAYRCKVSNLVRQVISNSAILTVGTAPTITAQPANQTVSVGSTAVFSVSATGTASLSYLWKKNGVTISGATSATYTTPSTTLADNGASFRCTISNAFGSVISDSARLTVTQNRVTTNLQALYTFDEGTGTTVRDVSGVGTALNLTIGSAGAVSWGTGKLTINSSTTILSAAAATKVISAATSTNQITMEAWVKPANTSQTGPAHIVGLPSSSSSRNVVLGQSGSLYDARLRTSFTSSSGSTLTSPNGSATTNLAHVVYTRDAAGAVKMYINGTQVSSGTVSGTFSSWSTSARFAIGNETGGTLPWRGELHLVAVYNRALTQAEVTQNFSAGANPTSAVIARAGNVSSPDILPAEFRLHQNYPNPFNPTTTIRYELPRDANVTIKLYNMLGQEVFTLVEGLQSAGMHNVEFSGTDLASGAYLYRMQAGDFVTSRKFMLIK